MDAMLCVIAMVVVVVLIVANTCWDVFERDSHMQVFKDPRRHL